MCWWIGSRAPHCRTVHENGFSKTPTASPKKKFIMKYLKELPQDTKPLRCCSGNRRRFFSNVIFESNVTANTSRSSDFLSTVPPIVNWGDWGCIIRNLNTLILFVFLSFNFISKRSHHSLTLPRSRFREPATVTLTPVEEQLSKWSHRHNQYAYSPVWKKIQRCTGGIITGPKRCTAAHLP